MPRNGGNAAKEEGTMCGHCRNKLGRPTFNKAGKKLKNLSDKEVEAVNRLSRGIVNKLLHGPLSHLRKPGSNIDEAALKLESFRGMFDLNE